MIYKKKHIVIFGSLRNVQEDSRNNILIMSLEKLGWRLTRCIVNKGLAGSSASPVTKLLIALSCAPFRWLCLTIKYLFTPSHKIVYIPYPPHLDAWIVCILTRLKNSKIIIDSFMGLYDTIVRDRGLLRKNGLLARCIWKYEELLLRSVDLALVDTREHVHMLQHDYNLPNDRVAAIPVGIDEKLWKPVSYPADRNCFNVLLWTTFIPLHGVDVVAMAAKLLEKEPENIFFTVIGRGQLERQFSKTLKTLRIINIKWIDQFLPLYEIQKYVQRSHCCLGVFGKQEKTKRVIPYKVYQTLASSRPLITAKTPAIERVLSHTENALLVHPGDHQELADAIKRLANDRDLSLRIAKEGRKLYESQLSNQIITKQLKEILKGIDI